jgi:protein gp37
MSKMFPFITKTFNPLGGECLHNCSYCWAKKLVKQYGMEKYTGKARLILSELLKVFKKEDFVFVCDMCDLFGSWVPKEMIQAVLDYIAESPATFLLLTKNPARYLEFKIPDNCVCGATIECDMNFQVNGAAPAPFSRIEAMRKVKHRKMVSVEPIMAFTDSFPYSLVSIKPEFVAVGRDNYNNHLSEPSRKEIEQLNSDLEKAEIKVYRKTI